MIDLDQLEQLEKAAVPAPWTLVEWRDLNGVGGVQAAEAYSKADGELIAAVRNALPALIKELRILRKVYDGAIYVESKFGDEYPGRLGRLYEAVDEYDRTVR